MPRLVKGGKYVYGWILIDDRNSISVPDEVRSDYNFKPGDKLIMMPGSIRSGGFSISEAKKLENSPLKRILDDNPNLKSFTLPKGKIIRFSGKSFCWTSIDNEWRINLSDEALKAYGINTGYSLLCVRGSGVAPGFISRGLIYEEAKRHSGIDIFK